MLLFRPLQTPSTPILKSHRKNSSFFVFVHSVFGPRPPIRIIVSEVKLLHIQYSDLQIALTLYQLAARRQHQRRGQLMYAALFHVARMGGE